MAQRMGSFSTRQACSGKGGEPECLSDGWVSDSVPSPLQAVTGAEWLG